MHKAVHLTDDDLMLLLDGEMDSQEASRAEKHLLDCVNCENRLQVLKDGSTAYANYRKQILEPALQAPAGGWASIGGRPASRPRISLKTVCVAGTAIAAGLVLAWLYFRPPPQPDAQQILAKAMVTAEPSHGTLLWTSGSYRFIRPALMQSGTSDVHQQHVQALFVKAKYNWDDPLSARSFSEWRRQLRDKNDSVTSIRQENGQQFYRVRTSTDSGVLRTASIMLKKDSYHPAQASFEFQGEDLLEVVEQSEVVTPQETLTKNQSHPRPIETQAGPEDELRVFAALDAIGAASEDPIEVKLDEGHHYVLVTGIGVPAEHQRQIQAALAALPNTLIHLSQAQPLPGNAESTSAPEAPPDENAQLFHQHLQELAGGARQLQDITDRAIETSNELFAQAHSLLVLAQEFPPHVESALSAGGANTLLALRQRHVGAMVYALRQLKDTLRPLLPGDSLPDSAQENLFEATRNLDRRVSRLLAGRYSQQSGEEMLKQLPGTITKVEALVRLQSTTGAK